MSDSTTNIIFSDPIFCPNYEQRQSVFQMLKLYLNNNVEIEELCYEEIRFIDAGENFEKILCPNCNLEIDLTWWRNEMAQAYASQFQKLEIVTPCGYATSLNNLNYIWPAGFTKYVIRIKEHLVIPLTELENKFQMIVSTGIRVIYTRY